MSEKKTSKLAMKFIKSHMAVWTELFFDDLTKLLDQVAEQSARRAAEYVLSMNYKSIGWKDNNELIEATVSHAISEG